MKEVIVADIMTKNPIVVDTNDTLSYVMRLFADKNISGVPVVREENFVGVVSESDIIKLIGKKESPEERALGIKRLTVVKVSDVMHRSPVFVYEYTKLSDAADLMNKHDITRLIVLDDKKKIVGIVARSDIIRGVAKELLYRILKKKEDEKVRKIDTDIDEVLNIVERKGSIDIDEIKKKLMLPEDKIEEWGKILESHGLLELFYPAVGKPKLRKKIK
jgi:CBS domain-containing protein